MKIKNSKLKNSRSLLIASTFLLSCGAASFLLPFQAKAMEAPRDEENAKRTFSLLQRAWSEVVPPQLSTDDSGLEKEIITHSYQQDQLDALKRELSENQQFFSSSLEKEEVVQEDSATGTKGPLKEKYATVLSLDGGGVRGYMQALWVDYLEKKTNKKAFELFDLIHGTSIGGIIALGLTVPDENKAQQPKLSTEDIIKLFTEQGEKLFSKDPSWWEWAVKAAAMAMDANTGGYSIASTGTDYALKGYKSLYSKYRAEPVESLLKSYFGEKKFDNLLTRTCATTIITSNDKTYKMNNDTWILDSSDKAVKGMKVWEVGRATSAAPTYFPLFPSSYEEKSVYLADGGMGVNNPSAYAAAKMVRTFREIHAKPLNYDNMIMLSLGTGDMPTKVSLDPDGGVGAGVIHTAVPGLIPGAISVATGTISTAVSWMVPTSLSGWIPTDVTSKYIANLIPTYKQDGTEIEAIIETLMTASSKATHNILTDNFYGVSQNYCRINPSLSENIDLDQPTVKNFKVLKEAAETKYGDIDKFIDGPLRLVLEADSRFFK